MSEFLPPSSESEFENNFKQIKPLMNETEAYYESSRCLFCYDAPCINACPSSIDIPLFIRQINSKNPLSSAKPFTIPTILVMLAARFVRQKYYVKEHVSIIIRM
ncbi:MAG: hypothetical protein IPL24_11035 [Bacteroidetes bacterium]|nr:hypothetical protein [Bacteroidota bacterium]